MSHKSDETSSTTTFTTQDLYAEHTSAMTYSCNSDDGFIEPYYDFDSELSTTTRRPRVGFTSSNNETNRGAPRLRPKSACSLQATIGKKERLHSLTRGDVSKQTRCSSALGIRHGSARHHQHSCPALSPTSDESPAPGDNSCIKDFRRSLKLLGLHLEGFDLGAGESSPKPDIKNAKSKVNSLVRRRTVSLEDLHEAVVRVGFPLNSAANKETEKHRQVLAKAIYEEWYFKKQEELIKHKLETCRQLKVKQWEMQHRRCEQMKKSQESYSEWLHKKRNQKQEKSRPPTGPTKPLLPSNSITPEKAQAAYESWKKDKEKAIKKKEEKAKYRQKMLEDNYKKEDAEKAYQEWKKKADKEWFSKIQDTERKLKEVEKEEEKKLLEKKKCAEIAYKGWKDMKDEEIKKKIKEHRQSQVEVQKRLAIRRDNRLQESQQAFLAWLDIVDERFSKELLKKKLQANHTEE